MAYFFRGQAPKTNFEELQVNPVVMSEERKRQEIAIPVNQPPAAIPILPEEKVSLFQRVRDSGRRWRYYLYIDEEWRTNSDIECVLHRRKDVRRIYGRMHQTVRGSHEP